MAPQWGPSVWRAMHYIALACPKDPSPSEMRHYWAFYNALGNVIPCGYCASKYKRHMEELPIDPYLQRGELFEWTVEIHNMVNRENGKPAVSADEAFMILIGDEPCNCGEETKKPRGSYRRRLARAIKTVAKENPGVGAGERMRLAHMLAKVG